MTIIYTILNIIVVNFILRSLFSINFREYQGFTTRFFGYGDDKATSNSIIFWITLLPIVSIFSYIIAVVFLSPYINYSQIWLVTPFFWICVTSKLIFLNRFELVNRRFILLIAILSSIIGFYISNLLFNGNLNMLIPEANNTIWQMYTIIFLFFVSVIKTVYEQDNYYERKNNYIRKKYHLYCNKFSLLRNLNNNTKTLIIAILIKEDFERPPTIRFFEKIIHSKTRNIGQNNSQSDWHSVYLLIRNIVSQVGTDEDLDSQEKRKQILRKVNSSDGYKNDVESLYYSMENIINVK